MNRSAWRSWSWCIILALAALPAAAGAEIIGMDFGPGDTPANWNPVPGAGQYSGLRDDTGTPTNVTLVVESGGQPFGITPAAGTLPGYRAGLAAIDGNLYQFGGTFKALLSGLVPGADYDFYLFGLRSGAALRQEARITGGTTLRFTQQAGDGVLVINDEAGNASRSLESYARSVKASPTGTLEVTVVGGGGAGNPFVIAGMALGRSGAAPAGAVVAGAAAGTSSSSGAAQAAPVPVARTVPSGPDVVGVYLGMSLDEAAAVVREGDPRIALEPFETDVGSIWGTRIRGLRYAAGFTGSYDARNVNEKIAVAGFAPPRDGYVGAIGRSSYLGDMLYTDLRASLVEKYGTPLYEGEPGSMRGVTSYVLSWSRGSDGEPLTDPAVIKACSRHGNNDAEDLAPAVMYLSDTKVQFNGQYDRCGFTMVVYAMPQDLLSLVRFYNIVLYDLDAIRKANAETIAMTEQQAQGIESERERAAAGKKPRL